jgi:hypothetical protein
MARINPGSEKNALIADGIGGEENIKVFLNKLLVNTPIIVDVADTLYETYDIKLKNTLTNKTIKVELETATKCEEWNDIGTLTMVLTPLRESRSGKRPYWPFGLNIPARKIYLHNDASIVEPKVFKTPQPFNIYLRVSKNLKHFFAVEWKDVLDFLNEEDSLTFMSKAECQTIPNVYDEVSNTNVFVSINPQTVLDERLKRLVYDDPIRLRDKIIALLN